MHRFIKAATTNVSILHITIMEQVNTSTERQPLSYQVDIYYTITSFYKITTKSIKLVFSIKLGSYQQHFDGPYPVIYRMCPFYFLIYILGNIGIGTGGQRAMAPRFYNLSIGIRFCPCKSTLLSLCERPRLECFLGYCLLRHSMDSSFILVKTIYRNASAQNSP